MTVKDAIGYALAGYNTPAEIKKLAENGITPDEVKALKELGYTKSDVFKLFEMVETSPKIQEAAPEDLEKLHNNPVEPQVTPSDEDVKKVDDIETLKKLLED